MDKYGLYTWHDYVTLAFLVAVMIASTVFFYRERRTTRRSHTYRRPN